MTLLWAKGCTMKNNVIHIIAVAIFTATLALTTQAEEVKVTGYQPDEFAVKGTIEHQLATQVVDRIGSELSRIKNGNLAISVVGYADQVGSEATNDRIGKDRAEAVENYLKTKFPEASIAYYSKGDEANSRMVIISWKIAALAAQPQPKPEKKNTEIMVVSLAAIGLAVLVIGSLFFKGRDNNHQPVTQPVADETPSLDVSTPPQPETRTMEYKKDDVVYLVPLILKDDRWHTPFPAPNDSRVTFHDAKKAVRGGMRDQPAIENLVAQGIITVKGEKS
jgi:hypothetical protein